MKIIDLLRLIRKHLVLLIITPVLLAMLVILFTRNPRFTYTSETTLYTGIATGGGVEMDKSFSFYATNTAFDNLINIIRSRQTQVEVAIRLLAQHLMLETYNDAYISKESYKKLREITPKAIYKLVVRKLPAENPPARFTPGATKPMTERTPRMNRTVHTVQPGETLYRIARKYGLAVEELKAMNDLSGDEIETGMVLTVDKFQPTATLDDTIEENEPSLVDSLLSHDTFSFTRMDTSGLHSWLPAGIDPEAYEKTVANLVDYMKQNDTNFVYELLNYTHRHYSVKAISGVNVQRVAMSDLVRIRYECDDPGICQQTLVLLTEVCIKNYRNLKENRSDAVVRYFEFQVKQAAERLKIAEDQLLKFNKDNNIINYYEQSKAIAVVKEDLDVLYNNKKMVLAGAEAAIRRIEEKMGNLQKIQLNNSGMIEIRNQLLNINTKIAMAENMAGSDSGESKNLQMLRTSAEKLRNDLKNSINALYGYRYTTEGLPMQGLLDDWLSNVILYEETRAGIQVLAERIRDFAKQYAIYAPAGAHLKRIEREINVSEETFLEMLHGLNQAKLKMQDIELSSNIKAVDPPYYPLSPNPTRRSMLVILAGLIGFLGIFLTILALEYFDNTLRNPARASRILNLQPAGIFPKITRYAGSINFPYVTNRLLEMMVQFMERQYLKQTTQRGTKTIVVFSTRSNEGKTILTGNLARKLIRQGYKPLVLVFSRESLRRTELSQTGYPSDPSALSRSGIVGTGSSWPRLRMILGYSDNRIDHDSPFLEPPEEYLDPEAFLTYQVTEYFQNTQHYQDILRDNHFRINFTPDIVLIEIPPVLYYSVPLPLLEHCDGALLVCRANRTWAPADQTVLTDILKTLAAPPAFILNGVEIPVIETILGDLPKNRSYLTRILKRLSRLQFFERYAV